VLINYKSCIGVFLLIALAQFYLVIITSHFILFLHLLSINHKCTQPCYFPMMYRPAAQKVKMGMKNSSTRSSRLCVAPVAIPTVLWSLPLFCITRESL
jgi:hypothetical protein